MCNQKAFISIRAQALLRCPASGEPLVLEGDRLVCKASGKAYRIEDGIPILLVEEAESIT